MGTRLSIVQAHITENITENVIQVTTDITLLMMMITMANHICRLIAAVEGMADTEDITVLLLSRSRPPCQLLCNIATAVTVTAAAVIIVDTITVVATILIRLVTESGISLVSRPRETTVTNLTGRHGVSWVIHVDRGMLIHTLVRR